MQKWFKGFKKTAATACIVAQMVFGADVQLISGDGGWSKSASSPVSIETENPLKVAKKSGAICNGYAGGAWKEVDLSDVKTISIAYTISSEITYAYLNFYSEEDDEILRSVVLKKGNSPLEIDLLSVFENSEELSDVTHVGICFTSKIYCGENAAGSITVTSLLLSETAKTYKVSFDLNGATDGGGAPSDIEDLTYGSVPGIGEKPLTDSFEKDGLVSDGKWYSKKNGVYEEFVFGDTKITGDVTLYLRWIESDATDITASFTDENFRAAVCYMLNLAKGSTIYDSDVRTHSYLPVGYQDISSLAGIENFVGLATLDCSGNKLTTLDVTGLTNLNTLYCDNNKLTTLNVTGLTSLNNLFCSNNQLTTLNVTGLTSLNNLYCSNNQLTTLNVTGLTNLNVLYCNNNKLTTLNVTGLTGLSTLDVSYNSMTGEDKVVGLNKTTTTNFKFDPQTKDITALFTDAKFRAAVYELIGKSAPEPILNSDVNSRSSFNVNSMDISSLAGIENFVGLTQLDCSNNKLTTLDVSKNTNLQNLYCINNQLTTLNLGANTLLYILECSNNRLTALNLAANTGLNYLYCYNNQLTTLDVSKNTSLGHLYCNNNQLTTLDVSKNTYLQRLDCSNNNLTTLDVSKNTSLWDLNCSNNNLTTLDVSKNTSLNNLYCSNNRLTALDLAANTSLNTLDCSNNRLTTLNVTNFASNLTRLQVHNNFMTGVDKVVGFAATNWNNDSFKFWKQNIVYTLPTEELKAVYGQTLADVKFTTPGWSWVTPSDAVGDASGTFRHSAKFTSTANLEADKFNTTVNVNLSVVVAKANPVYPARFAYAVFGQTLANINSALPIGWTWKDATASVGNAGLRTHKADFVGDNRYNAATDLNITVWVEKAAPTMVAPADLKATAGQVLSSVELPAGWTWVNGAMRVGAAGTRMYWANFTPADTANYKVLENYGLAITISAPVPIREVQKSGLFGIRFTSGNVVSDKAEFEVILPNNEKVLEVKAVIYDNTGNVMFETTQRGENVLWNLTNNAGRNVADGSYLIIVEVKSVSGTYSYSAKVGVKR